MKLMNMFARRPVAPKSLEADPSAPVPSPPAAGVIVPFPAPAAAAMPASHPARNTGAIEEGFGFQASTLRSQVIFDLPEIRDFLSSDHFRTGRQHGALLGEAAAHIHGREGLIAEFQVRLQRVIERKQAKEDRLEQMGLQARGLHAGVAEEVAAARAHLQRDMERLREQIQLADRGEGWIATALAQYELGFLQGVRARLDFCISQ